MIIPRRAYEISPRNLKDLVVPTAAVVLKICNDRDPVVAATTSPNDNGGQGYDHVAVTLSSYTDLSTTSCTGGLQAMVELIYDFAQLILDDPDPSLLIYASDRRIIADALAAYQYWKTAFIAADKASLGEGHEQHGDATEFNQKDWSDLNERLLQTASEDAPWCPACGIQMVPAGSSFACPSCGATSGRG